jgi:hypothetical protein
VLRLRWVLYGELVHPDTEDWHVTDSEFCVGLGRDQRFGQRVVGRRVDEESVE